MSVVHQARQFVLKSLHVRYESLKFVDCFHRFVLSKFLHLTVFGTDLWPNFGPNGCWGKKIIWYRGKGIVHRSSPKMMLATIRCLHYFYGKFWGGRDLSATVHEENSDAIINQPMIRGDITIGTSTRGGRMIFMNNYGYLHITETRFLNFANDEIQSKPLR